MSKKLLVFILLIIVFFNLKVSLIFQYQSNIKRSNNLKKALLLSLAILILSVESFSQVFVSTRLQTALANSENNDYVRGLILLRDQVDILGLDQQLYDEKATLEYRAYTVIKALQDKANNTQGNLKSFLEARTEDRSVFSYQSYWIANMIMIEARPSVFYELMNSIEIAEMDLDALLELDRPTESKELNEGTESVEPGLKIINADKLWSMGITGQGRIAMGHDTGVYPNHPALAHKWRGRPGNNVPINQAWWEPGSTTPTQTSDCDGHGSHTVGTMVGRSITTADTIGVAIDAEWIAAKTICTSPHTSNSVAAFQWAMNPDNDPNTINDMPDAISCSWYDPNVSDECSGIYKTTLDALEAAGIGVVFSAGNSGPGSSTVTKPKNINTDEVNVFSTGAISGASYLAGSNDPIASFSSRGPSTCGGTGALLIKPEISAPGVAVRSSGTATGYNSLDGTSMASPHVGGAIVLLKSAFPTLTGKQIKMALYNTCKDLGAAGEDNNYGKGLIDVYAAFMSLGEPDTVPPSPITDLSAVNPTSNSIVLQWTVPMDTSIGGVVGYDIRYALTPIADTNAFNNATQIPFSQTPDTSGATQTLTVSSLTPGTTYYFSIKSRDTWGNWSWLSNSASGATLAPPVISVTPLSLNHNLFTGTEILDTVYITNNSSNPSTLNYSISLENNTYPQGSVVHRLIPIPSVADGKDVDKDDPPVVYGQAIEGQGGPDPYGYKWIDSDEANGPQYVWNDIAATGTLVTSWTPTGTYGATDEGYAGPFNLGFNFKFYGQAKTQIYLSSNGFICFAPLTANSFTNASIPSTAVPNEIISPFWDDLDAKAPGTIHYQQEGNKFIIQWTNYQRFSGTASYTWQAVLYSSGKVLVYYKEMTGTINSTTVGVENATGDVGLQVAYNATYVKNNHALQIAAEPDWLASSSNMSGVLYNGNTVAVELLFRSEDYPTGDYSMDFIVTSNDPVTPQVTVPVSMNVFIPVELVSFEAAGIKDEVRLNWETATETNNMGFQVERRKIGTEQWNEVAFIDGKGTTTEKSRYSFRDRGLSGGKYEYRIKQVDFDGQFEYSRVVEVEVGVPTEFTLEQNYPNPFNPSTTITYSLPERADVTIKIFNSLGEFISILVSETKDAGYYKVEFDASKLASGTYIYQMTSVGSNNNFVDTKKMIFIK